MLNNLNWVIGNGRKVNFWNDQWCGEPLSYLYQMTDDLISLLPAKVCDYIDNFKWNIVDDLDAFFPNLQNLVPQITLPSFDSDDSLVWQHTPNGDLPLKKAYRFKKHSLVKLPWTKFV